MYKDEIMYNKAPKQTSKTLEDLPKIIKEKTEEINCKQISEKRARQRGRQRARQRGSSSPVRVEVKEVKNVEVMEANKISSKQIAGYRVKAGSDLRANEMIKVSCKLGSVHIANPVNSFQVPMHGFPGMIEVKDDETCCEEKTYKFKLVDGLTVRREATNDKTYCKQKPRHRDKLIMTEITDDKPKELAVSKEGQDKEEEEENRVKFKKLVSFLKTVPKVEATEEEKKLMSIIDNDEEDQLRIQKIIEKRRKLNV